MDDGLKVNRPAEGEPMAKVLRDGEGADLAMLGRDPLSESCRAHLPGRGWKETPPAAAPAAPPPAWDDGGVYGEGS